MISEFFAALLLVTVMAGVCTLISVGLEATLKLIWRRMFRAEPPVDFLLILSYLVALLIAIWGAWIVPKFQALFDSFGADLPWTTRLVMQYHYLLGLPLVALLLLHFRAKGPDGGTPYVIHVLFVEFALSVLVVMSMYLPIFPVGEAVPG